MKRVILSALAAGIFATAAAQEELTLRKCLEIGLENNYDIRIVRNGERISDNNATAANAGMVPTIDFEAGYSGALDNERTTPREGDAWSDNGIYDQTLEATSLSKSLIFVPASIKIAFVSPSTRYRLSFAIK